MSTDGKYKPTTPRSKMNPGDSTEDDTGDSQYDDAVEDALTSGAG